MRQPGNWVTENEERKMKGDDISERLIEFAVRVLRLVDSLPKTLVGKHIGSQLARAATAAGANYEEGRGAESRADFIQQIRIKLIGRLLHSKIRST